MSEARDGNNTAQLLDRRVMTSVEGAFRIIDKLAKDSWYSERKFIRTAKFCFLPQ